MMTEVNEFPHSERFDDKSEINGSESGHQPTSPRQPKVLYEPSYRMVPSEDRKFNRYLVETIIRDILYNTFSSPKGHISNKELVKSVSNEIKERVQSLRYHRYKIVVLVTIGTIRGQGMQMVSRCIWDTQTDDYASSVYEDKEFYVVASVYGLYHE